MGLPEDNRKLRQLARAVMNGELDRGEYQFQRRRLVDSWTGDTGMEDDSSATDPGNLPVLVAVPDDRPDAASDATLPSQPPNPAPQPPSRDGWLGLVAILLVMGLIAGLLAWLW